jgi:hypothetical protein
MTNRTQQVEGDGRFMDPFEMSKGDFSTIETPSSSVKSLNISVLAWIRSGAPYRA